MDQNEKTEETAASVTDLATRGMFLSEALYEILGDRGLVTKSEVIARIRKLKSEITVNQGPPS